MKRSRVWHSTVALLCLGMLLASCGDQVTAEPGTGAPAPGSTSSATPARPTPVSTSSTPPQVSCAAFLPSAPCATYTSTSGTAGGQDVPWVAPGSLMVQLNSVNGDLHLSVKTNCAPIGGPVDITGDTMTVGDLAIGAIGCREELGRQDQWVLEFLTRPVAMTFSQDTLIWTSGTDTLSFKSA